MPTSRIAANATSTCFRAPGAALPLDWLLRRARPGATQAECEELVQRGAVRVAGHPVRKPGARVAPGRLVEVVARSDRSARPPEPGLSAPVWRVLVPSLPWRRGLLAKRRDTQSAIRFERRDERGGVADLRVQADAGAPAPALAADDVRRAFAGAGHPLLGDAVHAGILVDGGLRLWRADDGGDPEASDWWPDEPVFPGDEKGAPRPVVGVSAATARILRRGHPWVLLDDETDDPAPFAPGTRVELRSPEGESLGVACIEGTGRLTARLFHGAAREGGGFETGVEARVAAALRRRRPLLAPPDGAAATDAYRLIHGEADGLPGLFVDRLGNALRVLITSPGTRSYRDRALDALVRHLEPQLGSDPPVVEVVHLRDRPDGALECTRVARGPREMLPAGADRLAVRERGVAFRVDLGLADPTRSSPGVGLYLDQRENRARLARGAKGRLLNLFAHTGAFSVAWLAAGGDAAVSVDLSGAYLRWLEENLTENGLAGARHESVRQDGRHFLETLAASERFDAIVLDPPTAAASGRRFWSVAKELPPLARRALSHLAPGGRLLVSRNDRRGGALDSLVASAAAEEQVRLARVETALPGIDFPRLDGFPEGDAFAAVIATRDGDAPRARRGRGSA